MKRLLIIVWSALATIAISNYIFYKSLYNNQISYIFELLNRQVQIVGLQVDETNNGFLSDLNQVNFDGDLTSFFINKNNQRLAIEKMKLFFSKYQDFITGIKYYDNKRNEFTLKQDTESGNVEWLESQPYVTHAQSEIYSMERLSEENRKYNYYLPVYNQMNETIGNLVVTVDFQRYFRAIFTTFNYQDYQWQWVVSDTGEIIFNNYGQEIQYSQLDRITSRLAEGSVESTIHSAIIDGERQNIISSYYSTQLLQRDLGLVFSAPTAFFQKFIVRNSLFIVIGTLSLVLVIIYFFIKYLRHLKTRISNLGASENMLFRLIEEMPVGVIIYNDKREILKANKIAADEYSFKSGEEMEGKIFPETAYVTDFASADAGLNPNQFVTIKNAGGDIVLYRKSIPVVFKGEEATMEMLVDVTMLDTARKKGVKANEAKTEFLARVSYEMRTPLNGIIGITDLLNKHDLSSEDSEMIRLLRGSTEVLISLINDILDISKIESGNFNINEDPFKLRDELKYCTDLAKINLPSDSLKLTFDVDYKIPDDVIGDPVRLRQILTVFLNNSISNTDNGEIKLNCSLKSRNEGSICLLFEINDTGRYFDKNALKKIYGDVENIESKAFLQNEDSPFSISLARKLVELMGGTFSSESPSALAEDHGTRLIFTLNLYLNERSPKNIDFQKITSIDKLKALVIAGSTRDDNTLAMLHQTGMMLTITTFMKATVNQLRSNQNTAGEKYDILIILDDMNLKGFEAAEALWQNKLSQNYIIFMISSNDVKGNYLKCLKMGVDHYLIKPVTPSELTNTIKQYFTFTSEASGEPFKTPEPEILKIMVVEDNKLNLKVIGSMLGNMGYKFDISEDGYSAFLMAKSKKYDLIFMDLMLPEIDGFEASQKILKIDKNVKIVALTADILPETRRKAELAGVIDFLTKPVRTEELKRIFTLHFKKK